MAHSDSDFRTIAIAGGNAVVCWDQLPADWGDYTEIEKIAEGGMGMVYRGRHRRLGRLEAIKVVRSGQQAGSGELARFRFEAEAAAGLDHPNIVPIYGVGEISGVPYFAMKWVDGGELAAQSVALRPSPRSIARILAKVARAIDHAHRQGILHRDLKPSNVLIDAAGEPHVTDFGLAKLLTDPEPGESQKTRTGAVLGTPQYMAPEQARGEKKMTVAADVYGLGGILYELLCGKAPFTGRNLAELLRQVANDPPIPPRAINASAQADLEAVCLKCLEKEPTHRYPSALAVAEELDRVARGEPVSVRPPAIWDWLKREVRKVPMPFPGYVWEVKVWFGAIMAIAQSAVFGLAATDVAIGYVWAVLIAAWTAAGLGLYWFMAAKFTRLPETEQHSVMIAVGQLIAQIGYMAWCMPFIGPADQSLAMYPAQAALNGLAFFVIGATHWGRFYFLGLAIMGTGAIAAVWPAVGPLVYGWATAVSLWYWAYAVKNWFATPTGGS